MGDLIKLTINKGQGGVGGVLLTQDHISGYVYDSATYPTPLAGFDALSALNPITKLLSLQDAINLGINDTHSDETKATGGSYLITTAGVAGDVWYLFSKPTNGVKVQLGTYTVKSGDAVADAASGLTDSVNLGFNKHGYAATLNTATVELTAPDKQGVALNDTNLTFSSFTSTGGTGTGATTITQFSGGVGSEIAPLFYHLQQAYLYNSQIVIYLGMYDLGTFDATKVEDLQNFAEGTIRQTCVYSKLTYAASMVTSLQTSCETLNDTGKPMNVILDADFSATTGAALATTRTLISATKEAWVSVSCGESYSGESHRLSGVTGMSTGMIGALLGILSNASVEQSITDHSEFDLRQNNEMIEAGLSTGENVKELSDNLVTQLNNYGYIFPVKESDDAVYFSDSHLATPITNDYNHIERTRTMDKAGRDIKKALTPLINSRLYIDTATGQMQSSTIQTFKGATFTVLEEMAKNGEISTQADGSLSRDSVEILSNQNVIESGEVVITVKIVPVGVARAITVNIKFAKRI